MKSAVEDDDSGWVLGIPEKMKNNANWVDITHEFKGACKGKMFKSNYLTVVDNLQCILMIKFMFFSFIFAELNLGELLHDKL